MATVESHPWLSLKMLLFNHDVRLFCRVQRVPRTCDTISNSLKEIVVEGVASSRSMKTSNKQPSVLCCGSLETVQYDQFHICSRCSWWVTPCNKEQIAESSKSPESLKMATRWNAGLQSPERTERDVRTRPFDLLVSIFSLFDIRVWPCDPGVQRKMSSLWQRKIVEA